MTSPTTPAGLTTPEPEPLSPADLPALLREGSLAARHPEIAPMLAALAEEQWPACGPALARLDPDAVLAAHPATPVISIAVTGHGELSALRQAIAVQLARHGLLPRLFFADFGGYVHDLSDASRPLRTFGPQLVLCLLDPVLVFEEIAVPWRVADVERVLRGKVRMLDGLAASFAGHSRALLVYNTLPLPRAVTAQLVDHRSRAELGAVWREANAALLRLAFRHPGLVVLDVDPMLAGGVPASDPRLSTYTKSHLSAALLGEYAREVGHLARHLAGRTKKTLVLDLDETVWGGVLGDDGAEGIEVAESYRGEAFRSFQKVVKQLGSQGVLVAAVSKNEAEPVLDVLRTHPGMTLREEDFVHVAANWKPKPENIRRTAAVLNLGADSFVFADDSGYECGLVRRELPEVAVVRLDDEPALHAAKLLRDGWFDVREVTDADRDRPAQYRAEQARSTFLDGFDSIEDYLRELQVEVRLADAGPGDIARVSQLTLRTNQFNLTTVRLQPEDVRRLAADPDSRVLTIRSRDRFGDNGLVGAVFTHRAEDGVHVDNFLLSCRVFSRGVEQACLAAILRDAAASGADAVHGTYRVTAKNGGVREFFPQNGFRVVADGEGGTEFRHDLAEIAAPPGHVTVIEEPAGAAVGSGEKGGEA